jgi:hypothetical protein
VFKVKYINVAVITCIQTCVYSTALAPRYHLTYSYALTNNTYLNDYNTHVHVLTDFLTQKGDQNRLLMLVAVVLGDSD